MIYKEIYAFLRTASGVPDIQMNSLRVNIYSRSSPCLCSGLTGLPRPIANPLVPSGIRGPGMGLLINWALEPTGIDS